MSVLLFIGFIVFLAVLGDHIRFTWKINSFLDSVYEFYTICDSLLDSYKEYDVVFSGRIFYMYVKKGDYESFVRQIEFATCELMDRYDRIDERYISELGDDLYTEVETNREYIQDVQNAIRITKWENGWK